LQLSPRTPLYLASRRRVFVCPYRVPFHDFGHDHWCGWGETLTELPFTIFAPLSDVAGALYLPSSLPTFLPRALVWPKGGAVRTWETVTVTLRKLTPTNPRQYVRPLGEAGHAPHGDFYRRRVKTLCMVRVGQTVWVYVQVSITAHRTGHFETSIVLK